MKYRLPAIILIIVLCLACFGCGGGSSSSPFPFRTEAAPTEENTEATAAPTEAPTEAPTAAPTPEEQKAALTFINGCGCDIIELYVSPSGESEWGKCMGFVDADESFEFEFDELDGEPGDSFDIGALDADNMNYDVYDVLLSSGDVIELKPDGDEFICTVTHENGSFEEYPVDCYPSDEPYEDAVAVSIDLENYSEYRDGSDGLPAMSMEYSLAHLGSEYFDSLPELAGAMEQACDSRRDAMEGRISGCLDESEALFEENGWNFGYCSYAYRAFVRRADSSVVSVLYEERYEDGLRSERTYMSDNFNSVTGERMEIEEVIQVPGLLVGCINDKLSQSGTDALLDRNINIAAFLNEPDNEDIAWTVDHEGLTFYFNRGGEFGYIAETIESIVLPFDEYVQLGFLYGSGMAEYAVSFPSEYPFYAEIDGTMTQFYVDFTVAGEEGLDNMAVKIGQTDKYYRFSELYFDRRPVYVRTGEGSFLYVFGFGEYDEDCLFIYKLTSGGVEKVGEAFVTECMWSFDSDDTALGYYDYYITTPITDPQNMIFSEYFDMLGTMVGSRSYYADDNCMPVSYDCFWFYDAKELGLKADITLTEVDYDGNELGEAEISAGTMLTLLRSDGESWVDFYANDGSILRAYVVIDWEQGEPTINGVSIYDLFNAYEIIFAG